MLNKMIDGMYIDGMYVSNIDGVPMHNAMHNAMIGQKRKIGKGYVPGTIKNEEPTKKRRV